MGTTAIDLGDPFGYEEILSVSWQVQLKQGSAGLEWEGGAITARIPRDGIYTVRGMTQFGRSYLEVSSDIPGERIEQS